MKDVVAISVFDHVPPRPDQRGKPRIVSEHAGTGSLLARSTLTSSSGPFGSPERKLRRPPRPCPGRIKLTFDEHEVPVTTPAFLLDPPESLLELARTEQDLKVRYIRASSRDPQACQQDDRELLLRSAAALEVTLALAGFVEAAQEVGARSVSEVSIQIDRIRELARTHTGLDPIQVVATATGLHPATPPTDPSRVFDAPIDPLVRTAAAFAAWCPIDYLTRIAELRGMPQVGYRCQRALESLRAFVLRNTHEHESRRVIAGQAYAEGRLSIAEIATFLGERVDDAIFWLEEHGYGRSIDTIVLSDEKRRERLEKIRADRLSRQGRPTPSRERILSDTVASERLEGVDARGWLTADD